jgi:hypothetical protein
MIVQGRVYAQDGSTIPGALVHDGSNAIETAFDGSFEIETDAEEITAVMVGFEQSTLPVSPVVDFTLRESSNSSLNSIEIIALRNRYNPAPATAALLLLLLLRIMW